MPGKIKNVLGILAAIMLLNGYCSAWHSKDILGIGGRTHRQLSITGVNSLHAASTDYADIFMPARQTNLLNGCSSERGHLGGIYNGGDVGSWWVSVKSAYKTFAFSEAYKRIGEIVHLTQDQAVPAHAANIEHGFSLLDPTGDNFEAAADDRYIEQPGSNFDFSFPERYYQPLQNSTRLKLSSWLNPGGTQYWNLSPVAQSGVDTTLVVNGVTHWGSYGAGGDTYAWADHPEILAPQLAEAVRFSVGVFAAASERLPALVRNPIIAPQVLNKDNPATITFQVLENRKPDVGITITVDGKDGWILRSTAGNNYSSLIEQLAPGTDLPWEKYLTIPWDGQLSDGSYVSDGRHVLTIEALDKDENDPEPKTIEFTADYHPPVLSLGNLFTEWEGISTNIVPTLETTHNLTITDAGSGIKTVLVTGPSGVIVDEVFETPLVDEPYSYNLENLSPGAYTITTTDALGQETMAQFIVGVFTVAVNLDKSDSLYSAGSDKFTVKAAADVNATFGIKKLEFISPSSTKVVTDFENTSTTTVFDLMEDFPGYNFDPPVGTSHSVTYDYTLRVWDGAGNYKTQGFHVSNNFLWDGSLLLGGNSTRETDALDLRDSKVLNGAILPVGPTAEAPSTSRMFPPTAESSLDLSLRAGSYSEQSDLGKVEVFVKTSDLPDLSDAEYVLAATRHLTGTQGSPDETTGVASYQVSFQDVPSANITLKRYYQVKSAATPAFSDNDLHLCIKFSTTVPGHCEYGYTGAPVPMADFEVWGIFVWDGSNSASAGNSVYVPEGQNVQVTLGGFLNVLFENVTHSGYLSYSIGYGATLPGQTSLMSNAAINLTADSSLSYSGDIRIAFPYSNSTLSQEQEGKIQGYRILPDGGADWLATNVNTENKTVTATTQSLGLFTVAAPAYSTTYSYDYADMAFRSGESDVTMRQVEQNSPEWQGIVSSLGSKMKNIASNLYYFGPEGKSFPVAAAVGFYTDGSNAATTDIYEFNGDQSSFIKLPKTQMNFPGGSVYMANVTQFHSYFALLQSSEPATVELLPDSSAPVTGVSFSVPYFEKDGRRIVSSTAVVSLAPIDPEVAGHIISGVATTYYIIDADTSTAEPLVYTTGFSLSEGSHALHYASLDEANNLEEIQTMVFDVDGTPPATSFSIAGSSSVQGGIIYTTTASTFSLTAMDPVSTDISAGPMVVFYLVDVSTQDCATVPSDNTAVEGTCQNPYYTKPFALSPGVHTVYYASIDKVSNEEALKTVVLNVSSPSTALLITPSSGPIGVPFTIEGAGFGTYSAGTTVVLLGGATAPLTLWTDTKIQGTIPGALAAGQYPVVVKRGAEVLDEVSPFIVTQPALYALTPSSGAIGLPFTITGESFGNYVAGYTRVLLGGATMPLTLWTDTKIQGTIPGTLPVGDYELLVERALNGGVVRTSTAAFSLRDMEAYWLAPSSGPIGMPFTITGVGFGNYSSVYTHVLIGDTTAPLTLWTDAKIQGTVPGSLASGQYPVLVERRTSDGGVMQTSPMTFEVVNVDVASMTPIAGPIGLPFTIYGGNFGNYVANYTRVLIGGTTAPLTLWTADKLQGAIPGALGPGEYPVIVERELNGGIVQSQALAFTVSTPTAFSMSPSSGPIGLPFTINGESFGNYSAVYTGVLINGATVPLTLWTDTQIKGTIPGNLAPGQYPVVVGRMTSDGGMVGSNALTFEVVGVNVASMTPVAGPIGLPFTIYGAGFGNFSAGFTKVLIGGTTCPLTLWTDTKIQGTVPGSLAAGEYPVVVERTLNGGQVQSLPVAFTLAAPEAYSLSPASGPIGLPFTIMGANFGNYVANYTKVLIGGVAAPLTLWTDTKIQGTIPGSLVDGAHEVIVERALNGGVVRTSTFTFTVGTPYLDTLSPSTASVIAPFTITGYNFGNYVANYTKVLINGTTTALTLWTDTKIQGKLPFLLAGTYPVQMQRYLNGGLAESATAYINVEEPVISSMTPVSGAAGTVFNLYGTGFGPYDATIAKAFIGGVQCSLSLWTDTKITGTVPSGLSYGTHTVVAMRGQAVSNGLEFYIPGGYNPSMMRPGTGPSALEFKLGEVYVYPDPAKGGKVPTFHIEIGTADSVKLKVFTVAGQLAHETTLTGSPQAVGAVYAYEYAWAGRIASGVYYYTVEAERAGKKLKAKGKFSVVR